MEKVLNVQATLLRNCTFQDIAINEVLFNQSPLTFKIGLNNNHVVLNEENGIYDIQITLNLKAYSVKEKGVQPSEEDLVYIANTVYSGIFTIQGFTEEELDVVLNVNCPSLVFPYARAEINRMLSETQMPKPALQPHQFDLIYQQKKMKEKEENKN